MMGCLKNSNHRPTTITFQGLIHNYLIIESKSDIKWEGVSRRPRGFWGQVQDLGLYPVGH